MKPKTQSSIKWKISRELVKMLLKNEIERIDLLKFDNEILKRVLKIIDQKSLWRNI